MSHITTKKCSLDIRAIKSERLFTRINEKANDIGMQVNSEKTQMLCIHSCVNNNVKSHIKYGNEKISSTEGLKILGFTFDTKPNANKHVELLIQRFYSKLWSLRFLKKSGLEPDKMLEIYNSTIRSAVEYCGNVYHSMITQNLSNRLESIQQQALRIIYGYTTDVDEVMAAKGIETLAKRRESSILRFALKNEHTSKYGKRWFKETEETNMTVRNTTRMKYKIPIARTERMNENPLIAMTRALNKYYSK